MFQLFGNFSHVSTANNFQKDNFWSLIGEIYMVTLCLYAENKPVEFFYCHSLMHFPIYAMLHITIGPTQNDFGYYEHITTVINFFSEKNTSDSHQC